MVKNMGSLDRWVRAMVAAPAAGAAAYLLGAGTVPGIALAAVAVVMAGTALVGFCPLYRLVGVNTRAGSGR